MRAKDFRAKAWSSLKGNWGVAVLVFLVNSIVLGACGVIPAVGALISLVISGPMTLGVVTVYTNLIRGEKAEVGQLFDGFKNFVNAFVLYLVNNIFIALWSLLLIVPGIIKTYAYSMSFYILRDNPEMTQAEARKASIEMMQGNKWRLFCLELSFIGWILLSILTFGILMFWVAPYMQTAIAAFYEDLKAKNAPAVEEVAE